MAGPGLLAGLVCSGLVFGWSGPVAWAGVFGLRLSLLAEVVVAVLVWLAGLVLLA